MLSTIIDLLPEINSIWALLLYSFLAYILSMLISRCAAYLMADQIDVEARVRANIIKGRMERELREKKKKAKD